MRKRLADGDGTNNKIKEHSDLDDQMPDCKGQCNDKEQSLNWLAIMTDQSSSIGEMQYLPPTLLEALDLALANILDSSDQVSFPNEINLSMKNTNRMTTLTRCMNCH